MDLTSLSGGLMLVALAAVWFVVFIPSWASRSTEKETEKTRVRELRDSGRAAEQTRSKVARVATASARILLVRSLLIGLFLVSLGALAWGVALWTGAADATVVLSVAGFGAICSVFALRAVNLRYRAKLSEARTVRKMHKIDPSLFNPNKDAVPDASRVKKGWTAPGVPEQLYRGSEGTIIEQSFAEVVELPAVKLEGEALDEILRRRRANG